MSGSWRDDSTVNSTYCSRRGPRSISRGSDALSWSLQAPGMTTVHIHTCRQMLIHINKINKSFLKSKEIDVKLGGGAVHL